jgi:TPR repeat protein
MSLSIIGCSTSKTILSKPKTYEMSNRHVIYLKGLAAEKKRNYSEAVKHYQKAANLNHFQAKTNLGYLYFNGLGVQKNYKKAFYWNKQVVDQAPDPIANFNLGLAYLKGLGVDKNYQKAMSNYKIARKMGHVSAVNSLGYMYDNGLGVKTNKQIARDYYIEAATKGDSFATNNLGGIAYKKGNYKEARQWYERAVSMGNKLAIKNLENLNIKGL